MILKNAQVFTGQPQLEKVENLVIEGNKIQSIRLSDTSPSNQSTETIDLKGKTLMPGMVAGHLHITYHEVIPENPIGVDLNHPPAYIAVVAAKQAERLIQAGFTSGVGAGSLFDIDVSLKELINEGIIQGPRLHASGRELATTGGPLDLRPGWWDVPTRGFGANCDGPEEFRKAVREETNRGVDIIKIYPEGGRGLRTYGPDMTLAELEAATQTAHDRGRKIRAHVVTKETAKRCLAAGVDIIDHADEMDEELIDLFAKHNTFVLPSLYILWATGQASPGTPHAEFVDKCLDRAAEMLPLAQKAGIRLVSGDDFGATGFPHTDGAKELAVYVNRLGIDAAKVLQWATINGIDMMGRKDELGSIETGKIADLLVIDGNPLEDITCLSDPQKIKAVIKDGKFVRNLL